jgi:hypothetical protein
VKKRRKSRRVLMAEALRRGCDPVLFALGFRNPKKTTSMDRWAANTRRNVYLRWRGTDYDEIEIFWSKYSRPRFRIDFLTSRVEQPPRDGRHAVRWVTHGGVRSWKSPSPYLGGGTFGPWMSPGGVAALVVRRMLRLDAFLRRGETDWCIWTGPPRRRSLDDPDDRATLEMKIEGDPWLDPESDYSPD